MYRIISEIYSSLELNIYSDQRVKIPLGSSSYSSLPAVIITLVPKNLSRVIYQILVAWNDFIVKQVNN